MQAIQRKEESEDDLKELACSRKYKPDDLDSALMDIQREKEDSSGYSVAEYLKEPLPIFYQINMKKHLGIKYVYSDSWILSLTHLQENDQLAVEWLQVCSYLSPDTKIPIEFLETWLEDKGQNLAQKDGIVKGLNDRHFINYDRSEKTFTIDDQLQKFLQQHFRADNQAGVATRWFARLRGIKAGYSSL
ncbi:MAG: hypothetical protein K940chlam7_01861 [Chlamydiae bacterium]|nr:hypothetical protein [Chlamydiota bacterium]